MQIKNSSENYGIVAKLFHWIVGLSIICLICVGFYMSDMEKSDLKFQIYGVHKAFGVLILALVSLRFMWRMVNVQPEFVMPRWENILSRANFVLLYFLMFAMPISGVCMSLIGGRDIAIFGLFTIKAISNPNPDLSTIFWKAHGIFGVILATSICLHIAASLYHQFVKNDGLLKKIL